MALNEINTTLYHMYQVCIIGMMVALMIGLYYMWTDYTQFKNLDTRYIVEHTNKNSLDIERLKASVDTLTNSVGTCMEMIKDD